MFSLDTRSRFSAQCGIPRTRARLLVTKQAGPKLLNRFVPIKVVHHRHDLRHGYLGKLVPRGGPILSCLWPLALHWRPTGSGWPSAPLLPATRRGAHTVDQRRDSSAHTYINCGAFLSPIGAQPPPRARLDVFSSFRHVGDGQVSKLRSKSIATVACSSAERVTSSKGRRFDAEL